MRKKPILVRTVLAFFLVLVPLVIWAVRVEMLYRDNIRHSLPARQEPSQASITGV